MAVGNFGQKQNLRADPTLRLQNHGFRHAAYTTDSRNLSEHSASKEYVVQFPMFYITYRKVVVVIRTS